MTNEEYRKMIDKIKMKHSYFNDPKAPFSEYVTSPEGKFVITITKSQYVFKTSLYGDHVDMTVDLIKKIRPDLIIDDWGNAVNREEDFERRNVFLFGYPYYTTICIPRMEMLSPEQYIELETIINEIKNYNLKRKERNQSVWELYIEFPESLGIKCENFENKEDEALDILRRYITEDYKKPNEVIIGKSISKSKKI